MLAAGWTDGSASSLRYMSVVPHLDTPMMEKAGRQRRAPAAPRKQGPASPGSSGPSSAKTSGAAARTCGAPQAWRSVLQTHGRWTLMAALGAESKAFFQPPSGRCLMLMSWENHSDRGRWRTCAGTEYAPGPRSAAAWPPGAGRPAAPGPGRPPATTARKCWCAPETASARGPARAASRAAGSGRKALHSTSCQCACRGLSACYCSWQGHGVHHACLPTAERTCCITC